MLSKNLSVEIQLADAEVRFEGGTSFLFRPFQGKVERILGGETGTWIVNAHAGEVRAR